MTPWSIGCVLHVVFGGKNTKLIAFRLGISGCAGQLSTISATFLPSPSNLLSCSRTHSSKSALSIQLFFWERYLHGKCLTLEKQRGFFDFPMTNTVTYHRLHYQLLDFAVLPANARLRFQLQWFVRKRSIKETKFIAVVYVSKHIVWEYCWKSRFFPRCCHFFGARLGFTRYSFESYFMPTLPSLKPAIWCFEIFHAQLFRILYSFFFFLCLQWTQNI